MLTLLCVRGLANTVSPLLAIIELIIIMRFVTLCQLQVAGRTVCLLCAPEICAYFTQSLELSPPLSIAILNLIRIPPTLGQAPPHNIQLFGWDLSLSCNLAKEFGAASKEWVPGEFRQCLWPGTRTWNWRWTWNWSWSWSWSWDLNLDLDILSSFTTKPSWLISHAQWWLKNENLVMVAVTSTLWIIAQMGRLMVVGLFFKYIFKKMNTVNVGMLIDNAFWFQWIF